MLTTVLLSAWAVTAFLFLIALAGYHHELAERRQADALAAGLERLADRAFEYLTAQQALDAVHLATLDDDTFDTADFPWGGEAA